VERFSEWRWNGGSERGVRGERQPGGDFHPNHAGWGAGALEDDEGLRSPRSTADDVLRGCLGLLGLLAIVGWILYHTIRWFTA
jgi:hypothetical protein